MTIILKYRSSIIKHIYHPIHEDKTAKARGNQYINELLVHYNSKQKQELNNKMN